MVDLLLKKNLFAFLLANSKYLPIIAKAKKIIRSSMRPQIHFPIAVNIKNKIDETQENFNKWE